jgi:hypothetical protein
MVSNGSGKKRYAKHCLNSVAVWVLQINSVSAECFVRIRVYLFQRMGSRACRWQQCLFHASPSAKFSVTATSTQTFVTLAVELPLRAQRESNESMTLLREVRNVKGCNSVRRLFPTDVRMNFFRSFGVYKSVFHLCQVFLFYPSTERTHRFRGRNIRVNRVSPSNTLKNEK